MVMKPIKRETFMEFQIVIGQDGNNFQAIGYDINGKKIEESFGTDLKDTETDLRSLLAEKSQNFISFPSALNLFKKAFPDYFQSPLYKEWERDYKDQASHLAKEELSQAVLGNLIEAKNYDILRNKIKRVLQKTNLVGQFEKPKFNDFLKNDENVYFFVKKLYEVLYGQDYDNAFKDYANFLNQHPEELRKWPIATYFQFLIHPDKHSFLKPEIYKTCAYKLGYEDKYTSEINLETYKCSLSMASDLLEKLRPYGAKDYIDAQSFMYAVGSEGYISSAMEHKQR